MIELVCLMGKSGTGKSTLAEEIYKQRAIKGLNTNIVKSYSSRPPRKDPRDWETHIFVTPEKYDEDLKHNRIMLNYLGVDDNGNSYHNWVSEDSFKENTMNIFVVDPKAYAELFNNKEFLENYKVYGFYLVLDEKIRKQRLLNRGSNYVADEEHLEVKHIENTAFSNIYMKEYTPEQLVKNISEVYPILERTFD